MTIVVGGRHRLSCFQEANSAHEKDTQVTSTEYVPIIIGIGGRRQNLMEMRPCH